MKLCQKILISEGKAVRRNHLWLERKQSDRTKTIDVSEQILCIIRNREEKEICTQRDH